MTSQRAEFLRQIPSVEKILAADQTSRLAEEFGRDNVRDGVREILDEYRERLESPFDMATLLKDLGRRLRVAYESSLRSVINGTGILIHTNLGRSPVGAGSWEASLGLVSGYSNLEFDLETAQRGSRNSHVAKGASLLFGSEAALLVNNNAAGVLLVLAAVAAGREVIVSRGELVEIGGSFRVPDVIQQGGARLREVGTTNKTRASDYADAVGPDSAAVLSVHQSNFQIVGFTEAPSIRDLAGVAHSNGIPLVYDEGSGHVVPLSRYGLEERPTIRELIEAGVDVVTFSTDKLIGSVQGGLVVGKKEIIDRCARHPLMRALRPGKESFALVTAALAAFIRSNEEKEIPLYAMLSTSLETLRQRGDRIAKTPGITVVAVESAVGGGTTPTETLPSIGLEVEGHADRIRDRLRSHSPPVIGRIQDDRFLLDLRTIPSVLDGTLESALAALDRS